MTRYRHIFVTIICCMLLPACSRLAHDQVQAWYEQGKLLREQGEPAEAMKIFLQAAHSGTPDEMLLGRVYSNMANICRQANEHGLAYDVYALSAEHFAAAGDELAYAYALNNMAWEQAVQGNKTQALTLIDSAVRAYPLQPLTEKVIESHAAACMFAAEYDSVLYYTTPPANDYMLMLRAQAYSFIGIDDSATFYAKELLPRMDNLFYLDDIYYILTHNDAAADKESIRILASERADVQKQIEQRHGKLMQAVQLLRDDLEQPQRGWQRPVEIALIGLLSLAIAVTGITVIRARRKLLHDVQRYEHARQEEYAQSIKLLRETPNLRQELQWNDYNAFCHQADKLFCGLATILTQQGLNEQDIRICVMVLIGLPHKQIAEMLPCSQKSIGKLKDLTAHKLNVSGGQLHKKLESIVCDW